MENKNKMKENFKESFKETKITAELYSSVSDKSYLDKEVIKQLERILEDNRNITLNVTRNSGKIKVKVFKNVSV